MKLHLPHSLLAALCLGVTSPAVMATEDHGGIIFIGDSITHGGDFRAAPVPSYRYQLFKNYVDNGVEFKPMGTVTAYAWNVTVPTPDYRGKTFENVHEAAASARTYHMSGHEKLATKDYPRYHVFSSSVSTNVGPLHLKLGIPNTHKGGGKNQYVNGATWTDYTGQTFQQKYGDTLAQTACIMMGINDKLDQNTTVPSNGKGKYAWTDAQIVGNTHQIVKTLQEYNPNINILVMGLLPVGKDNGAHDVGIDAYNALLQQEVATWSSNSSTVTYADVSAGFYAENGEMVDTSAGAHPNAQGELIVAGNIARALGIGQRTMGYERKSTADLASHADLSANRLGITLPCTSGGLAVEKEITKAGTWTSSQLLSDGKVLTITSPKATNDTYLQLEMEGTGGVIRTGTYNFTLQMCAAMDGNGAVNTFSIFIGDGKTGAGILNVGEDGIKWGSTLLYGAAYDANSDHLFTQDKLSLRVVVTQNATSTAGVYNVWLGDQLIGECLTVANNTSAHKDRVLMGRTSKEYATYATLYDFSMELGSAYAPDSVSIP